MRQSMNQQSQRAVGPSGSFYLFYASALLGLLLSAWSGVYAEPVTGTSAGSPASTFAPVVDSKPVEKATSGSLIIPGTQAAVLTVSKEIQTSAPIVNASPKSMAVKKASQALLGSQASSSQVSKSSVVKPKAGYYLELPAPKSSSLSSVPMQAQVQPAESEALVTPAATVPVASVQSQVLQSESATSTESQNSGLMSFTDPESAPLDFSSSSSALPAAATDALIRVTLGLVAVLGLLLVFSRKVLPQLMLRYPTFFDNLKRTSQTNVSKPLKPSGQMGVTFSLETPSGTPLDVPQFHASSRAGQKSVWQRNFLTKAFRPFEKMPDEKKPEGAMLTLQGQQFNILSSTALGKDKDLHLVEIMGRQLVIASTPYTVSLIQELSPAEKSAPVKSAYDLGVLSEPDHAPNILSDVHANEAIQETETSLVAEEWGSQPLFSFDEAGIQDVWGVDLPVEESESIPEDAPASESDWLLDGVSDEGLAQTDQDASGLNNSGQNNSGLDDSEEPAFIRHYKSNNFATRPQSFRPLTDAELSYQRYLDVLVSSSERNAVDSKATERNVPADAAAVSAAYLDSVVSLNDYDDVYGY